MDGWIVLHVPSRHVELTSRHTDSRYRLTLILLSSIGFFELEPLRRRDW